MICPISFNKFSDVLPACTCARATDKLRSICLGVNILNFIRSKILAKFEKRPFLCVDFNGNNPLLKALRVDSRSS